MEASTSLREFLQQNGLRPEEKWEDRGAAIHMAVSSKLPSHASELLKMYPQDCVNAKDERGLMRGRVPLHNAAQLGLADVVLKLLDLEADINARTWTGWTALLLATKAQQDAIVSILLARGADVEAHSKVDIKSGGRKSFTALHLAAEQQSPNAVLQLLHRGAKCDFTTSDGDTALHLAVRARCLPAAALLLLHGASSEVRNEVGISPRDLIMKFKRGDQQKFQHMLTCNTDDAAEQFLSCVDGNVCSPNLPNAIHRAAADGKVGAIIYLLHMNPRLVVAKNEVGWQPLHTAARVGSPEAARTLLKHGAELDCLTKRKWTPVMLAVNYNRVSILRVLLEYHPNTMLRSSDGHDAMTLAKRHGDTMVGLLPSFRHVPSNQVPTEGKASPGARDNMLNVPGKPGRSRDPSPAQSESSELEGELFALSDATMAEDSQSWPKKLVPPLSLRSYNKTVLLTCISDSSDSIERLFQDLERTWYEKIQWSPEDEYGGISGPVKIAILDTGIDLDHEDFKYPAKRRSKVGQRISTKLAERPQRERIIAWRNFIGDPGEEEDVRDTVGHGTHIAGMLLSIAPRAQLYIAKTSSDGTVAKAGKDSGYAKTRRKGRRPVQEAMRWAIDQGVDIINLSLGFPYESSFELTEALEDANHKGIIVFAAAANHGNREAISWPARDRDLAICVTSGDDQNRLSRFAPSGNTELPVFITHGEDVYSQWPTNLGGGFRTMTGTSVSTPIAVGMAAMILAFLNTTSHWSQEVKREWLDRSKERRLRSTRGMGRLLEQICRDRNGLRVLSPKLMWEDNPNANPFQVLNIISQAFRLPG